ncbi:unnamed protein product [Closterium sp. Naga37s-1]|nr:unnamed protein product [Closterium sp. Naga37s-1]
MLGCSRDRISLVVPVAATMRHCATPWLLSLSAFHVPVHSPANPVFPHSLSLPTLPPNPSTNPFLTLFIPLLFPIPSISLSPLPSHPSASLPPPLPFTARPPISPPYSLRPPATAPLETIRTHMMCGRGGLAANGSMTAVFQWVLRTEGWTGLFRGNAINVLRVAPSKAIEMLTYDTVKRFLTPKEGRPSIIPRQLPLPISSIAGSSAGIASCLLTYPLELVKTRLTVNPDMYRGVLHAFHRIITEQGVGELYRGVAPSVVGMIPYAGANFYAYDTLCTAYRKARGREEIEPLMTLVIGSTAGCFAAASTFPLEVARKHLQMGSTGGRVAYTGMLQCMRSIVREQGVKGLYRGVVPSCAKMMPAAGISFMCYEVLKRVLIEDEKVR